MVDQAVMDVECLGMNDPGLEKEDPAQLCFIAFLPDVLDSKADGRNGYIDALKALAKDYKDRWVWVWMGVAEWLGVGRSGVGGWVFLGVGRRWEGCFCGDTPCRCNQSGQSC